MGMPADNDPFKLRENLLAYKEGRFKVKDENGVWRDPNDDELQQAEAWATARLEQLELEGRLYD